MKRLLIALVLLVFSSFAIAAVNINTATKEQLDALPGIGPVKAQAIVDYRNANGPFKTPADIMKVKGIKEGEFAKIKDQIAVSGVTTAAPAAPAKAEPAKKEPAKTAPPAATPPAAPAPAATPAPSAMSKADESKAAKEKATEEKAKKAADAKAAKEKAKAEKAEKAEKARMAKEQSAKEKSTSDKEKSTSDKDAKAVVLRSVKVVHGESKPGADARPPWVLCGRPARQKKRSAASPWRAYRGLAADRFGRGRSD